MSNPKHNFNNRERKTIILLSVIILFAAGIFFLRENIPAEQPATQQPKAKWEYRKRQQKKKYYKKDYKYEYKYKYKYKYSNGYNKKKYRKDKSYKAENLYGTRMIDSLSQNNDSIGKRRALYRNEKFKTLTIVDANTADSTTLCRIPGIGATIASIIIRQRERLGGFHSKEQLLECKYFTDDLLVWFKVDSAHQVTKLNINDDSLRVLYKHPYISYKQARALKNHRRLRGRIKNEEELRSIFIFTKEEIDKLLPYIEF